MSSNHNSPVTSRSSAVKFNPSLVYVYGNNAASSSSATSTSAANQWVLKPLVVNTKDLGSSGTDSALASAGPKCGVIKEEDGADSFPSYQNNSSGSSDSDTISSSTNVSSSNNNNSNNNNAKQQQQQAHSPSPIHQPIIIVVPSDMTKSDESNQPSISNKDLNNILDSLGETIRTGSNVNFQKLSAYGYLGSGVQSSSSNSVSGAGVFVNIPDYATSSDGKSVADDVSVSSSTTTVNGTPGQGRSNQSHDPDLILTHSFTTSGHSGLRTMMSSDLNNASLLASGPHGLESSRSNSYGFGRVTDELYSQDYWNRMTLGATLIGSDEGLDILVDDIIKQEGSLTERRNWQSMLGEVISGDLIKVEKKKIAANRYSHLQEKDVALNIWLELRSYVHNQNVDSEWEQINLYRSQADELINEVLTFGLPEGISRGDALEIVSSLLNRLGRVERSYSSLNALRNDKIAYNSDEFQSKLNCLISWKNTIQSLDQMCRCLQGWMRGYPTSKHGSSSAGTHSEQQSMWLKYERWRDSPSSLINELQSSGKFVEELLREDGVLKTFDRKIFAHLMNLVFKAKSSYLEFHSEYSALGLPSFVFMCNHIAQFPYALMKEFLKLRLQSVDSINWDQISSIWVVDQLLEGMRDSLSLSFRLRRDFSNFIQMQGDSGSSTLNDGGGASPPSSRNVNSVEMDRLNELNRKDYDMLYRGLKYYFRLLQFKTRLSENILGFKDAEMLETEWQFIQSLFTDFPVSIVMAAKEFGDISNQLIIRLENYLRNSAAQVPADKSSPLSVARWYSRVLESLRLRARKFLRFYRSLAASLEDAVDAKVTNEEEFLRTLLSQDYVKVQFGGDDKKTPVEHPLYIFLDAELMKSTKRTVKTLEDILSVGFSCLLTDEAGSSEHGNAGVPNSSSGKGCLLLYKGPPLLHWMGSTIYLSTPNYKFSNVFASRDLTYGKIRIIAKNSAFLSAFKKRFFFSFRGCVSESSLFYHSSNEVIFQSLQKLQSTTFQLAKSIISGVKTIHQNLLLSSRTEGDPLPSSSTLSLGSTSSMNGGGGGGGGNSNAANLYVNLLENYYSFASDFGYRVKHFLTETDRKEMLVLLISFAVDWVSFTCSDCSPTDARTFRWALMALEFVSASTRGSNIYFLNNAAFVRLKNKVSCCMSLLISHFQMEEEAEEMASIGSSTRPTISNNYSSHSHKFSPNASLNLTRKPISTISSSLNQSSVNGGTAPNADSEDSLKEKRRNWTRHIQRLEEKRNRILRDFRLIGHALEKDNKHERGGGGKESDLMDTEGEETQYQVGPLVVGSGERKAGEAGDAAVIPRIRWQQTKYIGGGAFGSVYECINLDSGEMMAVKEIKFPDASSITAVRKACGDEMRIMQMLHHPNVVNFYGAEFHRDKVYIFMEFCAGGSLASLLEQGPITDQGLLVDYTRQILRGLVYLHSFQIVHRDIKPDNILLDALGTLKLVDFGASKNLSTAATINGTLTKSKVLNNSNNNGNNKGDEPSLLDPLKNNGSLIGTPAYMSPEIITGEKSAPSSDIWALGCTLLQMITGKRPWFNLDNEWAIMYHLGVAGKHPALPEPTNKTNAAALDFIRACFRRPASERPTAKYLLENHEFLREAEAAATTTQHSSM